jgi:hypothetical protein
MAVFTTAESASSGHRHSGPIRDCRHGGRPHLHGSRTAYVKDKCRCAECRAANSAASKTAHRERVLGRWAPFVDETPARAHIQILREAGIGVDQIANLAGISCSHVRELVPHTRAGRPRSSESAPRQHIGCWQSR